MQQVNSPTQTNSCPIFIGGEGRSGTTLLSLMLNSHSQIAHGPELHFRGPLNLGDYILSILDKKTKPDNDQWESYRHNDETYAGFHFVNRCHRCGIDEHLLRNLINETMRKTNTNIETFSDRCYLVDLIGNEMRTRKGCAIWGIKIMRDIRILDQYSSQWAGATFIHLIRDGRDVAASQMTDHGKWGYSDIEQAAQSWVDIIHKVRSFSNMVNVIELRYEDIVLDTQKTTMKLFDDIGLPWENSVLSHDKQPQPLYDNPYRHPSIQTVTEPINQHAIGRWQAEIPEKQLQKWTSIAGNLLSELGYSS